MENVKLELQSEIKNGRVQVGGIVGYYEQHIIVKTGGIDFIRVSFF